MKPFKLIPEYLTEHQEQVRLIKWAALRSAALPELRMLVSIPNGGYALNPATGAKLKAEGLAKGFPDLALLVPRHGHGALFIEMKRCIGGSVRPEQRDWHERLRSHGYAVLVACGAAEAITFIEDYLRD